MIKKEFVRPGSTTWGYAWVGKVGGAPVPPDWPEFIKNLINDSLDWFRFTGIHFYLGTLPVAWEAVFHPDDKATIVNALKDANVVAYIANAHGEPRWAELWRKPPVVNTVDVEADVKPAMEQRGAWPTKPVKFAFLIHSEGMNSEEPNTWSHELRKASTSGSVVIGIKQDATTGRMTEGQWVTFQTQWCTAFFTLVGLGWSFDKAFRYTDWVFQDLRKFTVFTGDVNMNKSDLLTA